MNLLTGPLEPKIEHAVQIYDNTLREGEQPPGVVFTPEEKLEIAQLLTEIGIPWANVGFPAASKDEFDGVVKITKAGLSIKTAALSRLIERDIDATIDAGVDLVALFLGGSDSHLMDKLRLSEARGLEMIEAGVRRCKDRGVLCSFGVEDATRTPLDRLLRMNQVAADAGADHLVLPDTVGVLTPTSTKRLVRILKSTLKPPLGTHFHDDLGLALANTLAAAEAGAEVLQVTVNGAGERAGNTCLEELAVVLQIKYGLDLGLKLDRLTELCAMVHRASGTEPSEHKAITGKWCFTHESGIHVAGLLANPECYQAYPPKTIGREHEIVFGKHSGAQGVIHLAEREGLSLSKEARRRVLDRIKTSAERKSARVTTEQVLEWLREEAG